MWTLSTLLASPTIASKAWVYRQYDTMVRTSTVIGPGGDAAVVRLRGTNKALALKTDCNGRYVYLDPRVGGRIAVAEAARNVACTGARPIAITNSSTSGSSERIDSSNGKPSLAPLRKKVKPLMDGVMGVRPVGGLLANGFLSVANCIGAICVAWARWRRSWPWRKRVGLMVENEASLIHPNSHARQSALDAAAHAGVAPGP